MSSTIGTVNLPSPRFGDTMEHNPNRAYNRRASGNQSGYQTGRPFNTVYTWMYELTATQAQDLVDYIAANIGELVTIVDHYGDSLVDCMILTPDRLIEELSDRNCKAIKVTVRFLYVNP